MTPLDQLRLRLTDHDFYRPIETAKPLAALDRDAFFKDVAVELSQHANSQLLGYFDVVTGQGAEAGGRGLGFLPEIEPFFHGLGLRLLGRKALSRMGRGAAGSWWPVPDSGCRARFAAVGEDADCSASTTVGHTEDMGFAGMRRLLTRRI